MTTHLSQEEQEILLKTAREVIKAKLNNETFSAPALVDLPSKLQENGACFVTLTKKGDLRGCVGSIAAIRPLMKDVQDRALAAAFQDYRFPPLLLSEINEIQIEISCLTPPTRLNYQTPEKLLKKLRPHIDGVILSYQGRRATFLPQVWEKLTSPELFLNRLCQKMGFDQDLWRREVLTVEIYQAVKFVEEV